MTSHAATYWGNRLVHRYNDDHTDDDDWEYDYSDDSDDSY